MPLYAIVEYGLIRSEQRDLMKPSCRNNDSIRRIRVEHPRKPDTANRYLRFKRRKRETGQYQHPIEPSLHIIAENKSALLR